MTASPFVKLVRIALLLATGAFVTPICGAAQRVPEVRIAPATEHTNAVARQPWTEPVPLGEDALPLMAQLGGGAVMNATPLLLARASDSLTTFSGSVLPQPRREDTAMGLPLPEPGPLSAIIATVALAAFFFVRRAS